MKSRNKTTMVNLISILIVALLGFISGPVFSNMLGTEGYGIYSVYMVWVNISSAIFSLGSESAIAQASVDFDIKEQNKYQASVFSLGTISYLSFSCIIVLLWPVISNYVDASFSLVICGLMHGWGMFCITLISVKNIYEFAVIRNAFISIVIPVLSICISVFLIRFFSASERYWGRVLGETGVYFTIALILGAILLVKGRTVINRDYWLYTLPITLPMVINVLSNRVLSQCDRIMIQSMIGNSSVGIYSLAYVFASIVNSLWVALNRSWIPFFYDYQKKGEIERIRICSKNYMQLFSVITAGFILLSKEVYRVYANRSFWTGEIYIPIFAISYYIIFLYSFAVNYEVYYKNTKLVAIGTTIAAGVNIMLNAILIGRIGIIGALIATVVASLIQFVFHWYFGGRISVLGFPLKISDIVPGVTIVVISMVIFYWCINIWIVRWTVALSLGIWLMIKIWNRKALF